MKRAVLVAAAVALLVGAAAVVRSHRAAAADGPIVRQIKAGPHPITVVVAPGQPGRNIVEAASPHGIDISGTGPLTLHEGRNTISLVVGLDTVAVKVNVHGTPSTYADDECASRQLGESLAARPITACAPPAAGDASDIAAALVRDAHDTRIDSVALVSDDSPRGRAALAGATAAAAQLGVRVTPDGGAIVLLGSWSQAEQAIATAHPSRGFLAAPWLLQPSLYSDATQVTVATALSPSSPVALRYVADLAKKAPGIGPTGSGLAAYAGVTRRTSLQLWTPANIQFLPREVDAGHVHVHDAGASWTRDGQLALVRSNLLVRAP